MLQGEPILILGVFRSGTSLLANVLERMGVYLGPPEDFFPPNENNPGGYWEMRSLVELNLRAHSVLGMNFYQEDLLPDRWQESPVAGPLMQELSNFLERTFAGRPKWGWKEPTTTGLIPVYREVLKDQGVSPRYVLCVRHPLAVAASQIARLAPRGVRADAPAELERSILEQTVGMWVHYNLVGMRESKGCSRLVVHYEGFLKDPETVVRHVAQHVLSWEPSEEELSAAIAAVEPSLSHNEFTVEDLEAWPPIVGQTYDLCLRAAEDPVGFNGGRFDEEVEALWKRLSAMRHMIRPLQLPAGQMVLSWRKGQSVVKYSPTGKWQTLSSSVEASSGSPIQVDVYQTPCHIWIRRATWTVDGKERPANLSPGPGGMLQDLFGMKRLVVFGPNPLMTQVPPHDAPATLELEFMVSSNQQVLTEVVGVLRNRLDQVRR